MIHACGRLNALVFGMASQAVFSDGVKTYRRIEFRSERELMAYLAILFRYPSPFIMAVHTYQAWLLMRLSQLTRFMVLSVHEQPDRKSRYGSKNDYVEKFIHGSHLKP